jgi:N-acetylmuramoyl-L-alanine amidase
MSPEQVHYEIADWALDGNRLWGVDDCLWYYNPFSPQCETYFPRNRTGVFYTRINEHCFYNPTPLYSQT